MNPELQQRIAAIKAECEEILRLSEKATPGKWISVPLSAARSDVMKLAGGTVLKIIRGNDGCAAFREAAVYDASFIAHARNVSPAMARVVVALIRSCEYTEPEYRDYMESRLLDIAKQWEGK